MKNLICISAPSGSGKTTLCKLVREIKPELIWSVSCTTRNPRKNENDGLDYEYISKNSFEEKIKKNYFLEWAIVFENYYGTSRKKVQKVIAEGKDVLFDIDWQGAQQLSNNKSFDLVKIFILPPSNNSLENRLNARAQDTQIEVKKRMSQANDEISHYMEYDYIIINNDLEVASNEVLNILNAERLKRKRLINLDKFISYLRS